MKNTFGNNLSISLFGESHGAYIGAMLDGLAPGTKINNEYINKKLLFRKPIGKISTKRQEKDEYKIISGVKNNIATGSPICIIIPNEDIKSNDYNELSEISRPGHADYSAYKKYYGFNDYVGGGHFSGRLTTPIVALGAIVQLALEEQNIFIGTHILQCANIKDAKFKNYKEDIKVLNEKAFATLDDNKAKLMKEEIIKASNDKDSVGGILETSIIGVPSGVGEPWFDSIESVLSHALFSIPGVKGVEYGAGFNISKLRGSKANDSLYVKNNIVKSKTNNNGGINGGISNGSPILFRCAIKPTPSIAKEQDTINFKNNKNVKIVIRGRHDPAIVHRARVVVDALSAIVIYDLLLARGGIEYMRKIK
ncbi:MAG: chorismate synthase [Eubacteriales bacterium]|nr:chorismate synthase [Eubacteriales bacterium]